MSNNAWQLTIPMDAIVFDCDGTLSFIEGIDELAEQNGVGEKVTQLTQKAMNETGINPDLYAQRMTLVQPSCQQLIELGQHYFLNRTPDSLETIHALKALNKSIYVLSAGLNPAVKVFANLLGISEANVLAVDVKFNSNGHYESYDHQSFLTQRHGKLKMVEQLRAQHRHILLIGDGINDYEAVEVVDRFVGYGGAFYRENIAALCDFYIKCPSLAALLPLAITENESSQLLESEYEIYEKGLQHLRDDKVIVKSWNASEI